MSAPSSFRVLEETEHYLVVIKPRGLCTAPLAKQTAPCLCDFVFCHYPSIRHVTGKSPLEGGLLHRLDRDTEGLVLFAKTQNFYHALQQQARKGLFKKTYLAYCTKTRAALAPQGYSLSAWQHIVQTDAYAAEPYTLQCYFVKAEAKSARVRPIQHSSAHACKAWYTTQFCFAPYKNFVQATCTLTRGFRHQVRACLCSLGLPILGDPFYPTVQAQTQNFHFWATQLSFVCPYEKKPVCLAYTPCTNPQG